MPRHNFKELREYLDKEPGAAARRAKAKRDLEAEIDAFHATLGELRRARALTQDQLAKTLGVSQAQVSRVESQADLYLSTLESYVTAMGGTLELTAMFGDRRVTLELGDLAGGGEARPRARAGARKPGRRSGASGPRRKAEKA